MDALSGLKKDFSRRHPARHSALGEGGELYVEAAPEARPTWVKVQGRPTPRHHQLYRATKITVKGLQGRSLRASRSSASANTNKVLFRFWSIPRRAMSCWRPVDGGGLRSIRGRAVVLVRNQGLRRVRQG